MDRLITAIVILKLWLGESRHPPSVCTFYLRILNVYNIVLLYVSRGCYFMAQKE